ncbi:MAG: ABC transporter ATP-binding protein [Chloroflexi bacterium]|nr:ABC transporter ATP-binding protein [Chloroflexota bacterium]
MAKLEIHNLSVEYTLKRTNQSVLALQAVDLTVQNGEFVAIVGPSGCGKTTLLNLVAGLWPITQGKIHLNGRPVQGPGNDRAMVFQTPALLPWRTVQANVGYGLTLQGYSRLETQARTQRFIELVGLAGFEESYPHELSGGMQQRANLARALAVEPALLLLDEPLSAVDAQTREILQIELQRIWLATRHSALYVTHQIDEAIFLADKVVVMATRPGRIQAVIAVDLPRPRPLSIKRHPAFIALSEQIWQLLQRDVSFPRMEH